MTKVHESNLLLGRRLEGRVAPGCCMIPGGWTSNALRWRRSSFNGVAPSGGTQRMAYVSDALLLRLIDGRARRKGTEPALLAEMRSEAPRSPRGSA